MSVQWDWEKLFGKSERGVMITTWPYRDTADILYLNDKAETIMEVQSSDRKERQVKDFPVLMEEELPEKSDEGKDCFPFQVRGTRYRCSLSRVADRYCLCMLEDLDEKQCREAERQSQYKKKMEEAILSANEANQAKTRFLSEMSHDIRTPMNAIVGMTDIALKYVSEPERVEDCLRKIQTASGHLMTLINEILDMSRIESGKVVIQKEKLNLADLVHEILVVIGPQANAKRHHLHVRLNHIICENLIGDELHLRQVWMNVLSNAVKYTPDGGDIWITLQENWLADGKVQVELTVKDNGIGMSEAFLEHLFEPFERERNVTMSKIEGTGLGMAIVKQLVDKMEGTITVASELGGGSEFYIVIPMTVSAESDRQETALFGKRILILQGKEEKLEELPAMLTDLGMEADVAACGMDVIDLINMADIDDKDYFALLTADQISDIEISLLLPEICERKGKDFPIIMLSANDWSEMEYLMKQAGVTEFVPLPLFRSRLEETLSSYTKEGRQRAEEMQKPENPDLAGQHLLLVEDNELNQEIAKEILSVTGAVIDVASNGREGVEAFSQKPEGYYDLILMDIQMPEMDGLEATRQIRGLKRTDASAVPIIAMTANAFVEDRKKSIEAGMNDHIIKPLDLEQLMDCLKRWGRR